MYAKNDQSKLYTLKIYNLDESDPTDMFENEVKMHLLAASRHPNVAQIKVTPGEQ